MTELFHLDGQTWTHTFTVRTITDQQLPGLLAEADLRLTSQWLVAQPTAAAEAVVRRGE